jgi:hypothetical protein
MHPSAHIISSREKPLIQAACQSILKQKSANIGSDRVKRLMRVKIQL